MTSRYLRNLILWAVVLAVAFPLVLQLWHGTLWPSPLYMLLPILLLVGLWMLMLRQAQSGSRAFLPGIFGAVERRIINPPTLAPPRGFSHGILMGGQSLFLAGQDASDADGRIVAPGDTVKQFEQVLMNLQAVVEAAGGSLQDVVKLNIFVSDRRAYVTNLQPIGEIFRRHFGGHYPAMALVEVSGFFREDALIEMEGIAVLEAPSAGARRFERKK